MEISFVMNKDVLCLTAEQYYVKVINNQYNLISSDEWILQALVHNLLKMQVFKVVTSIVDLKSKIIIFFLVITDWNWTLFVH